MFQLGDRREGLRPSVEILLEEERWMLGMRRGIHGNEREGGSPALEVFQGRSELKIS